jgi:hypothetical protein
MKVGPIQISQGGKLRKWCVQERRSVKMAPHGYEQKPRVVGMQQQEKQYRMQLE